MEACAGEFGIALQFDGPAFVGFGNERNRASARRHGRRIIFRFAVNVIFRLLAERLQFFHRPAAARAHHAQARERERRGHDFHEMPAGNTVLELARALRKLALQPVLELRRIGQLIQAAPVTAARRRRGNEASISGSWRIWFHSGAANKIADCRVICPFGVPPSGGSKPVDRLKAELPTTGIRNVNRKS
jgi:hypothetical protein